MKLSVFALALAPLAQAFVAPVQSHASHALFSTEEAVETPIADAPVEPPAPKLPEKVRKKCTMVWPTAVSLSHCDKT